MPLPNGLGAVSLMAAPFSLSWLRLATSSSARFGPPALLNCAKDFVRYQSNTAATAGCTRNLKQYRRQARALRSTLIVPIVRGFLWAVGGDLIEPINALASRPRSLIKRSSRCDRPSHPQHIELAD